MIDVTHYGYEDTTDIPAGLTPGRVIEVQRELYTVICTFGETQAVLTGTFFFTAQQRNDYPCVGDFVLLKYNPSGRSGIMEVLPRKSKFSRTDFSGHAAGYTKNILEQVVAANFDYVFIFSALNNDFNVKRIARYLTAASGSGGKPVVILTNADLLEDTAPYVQQVMDVAPQAHCIAISNVTLQGFDALQTYLQPGKTVVLLGMSGVGKSSLLNVLSGAELMKVQNVREGDSRGRHTTTHRELFMLPSGAMVIDTPGMRELGLWDGSEGVDMAFTDIEALFLECKFSNCTHKTEPGCAVAAAIESGRLAQARWEAYTTHKRETAFVESKTDYLKQRRMKNKDIANFSRQRKKTNPKDMNRR